MNTIGCAASCPLPAVFRLKAAFDIDLDRPPTSPTAPWTTAQEFLFHGHLRSVVVPRSGCRGSSGGAIAFTG